MKTIPVQVWLTNGETLLQAKGTSLEFEDFARPSYVVQQADKPSPYYAEQGYIHLGGYEVHSVIEPTREELIERTVSLMRQQVQKVRADAEVTVMDLTKRINDLLMIGQDTTVEG